MMPRLDRILLVEGENDRLFHVELLAQIGLKASVLVAPPKLLGESFNTKGGVLNLARTLVRQMSDGLLTNFAVIVDADHPSEHGMGYQKTLEYFSSLVEPLGFRRQHRSESLDGFLFHHYDGLADIGLWIMPDNKSDGMFEDWIKSSIADTENVLFDYAIRVLNKLPVVPRYKNIHRIKAEVATWLAWQKMPGQGSHQALKNGLLAFDGSQIACLVRWLRKVYP